MNTVGIRCQRDVDAVVYHEGGISPGAYLRDFIGLTEDVTDLLSFFPQLDRIRSAIDGERGKFRV
jgi:hypothetical protein